jgi:hypothetical protein
MTPYRPRVPEEVCVCKSVGLGVGVRVSVYMYVCVHFSRLQEHIFFIIIITVTTGDGGPVARKAVQASASCRRTTHLGTVVLQWCYNCVTVLLEWC